MKKITAFLSIISLIQFFTSGLYAESEGEKLFRQNDPSGAVILLEQEIKEGKISSDTYNYLGLAYFQTGDYVKSIDAFERGMKDGSSNRRILCFNEGNVAYRNEDFSKAEQCFSLAIAVNPEFYDAVLNRANARLMERKYSDAVQDYTKYITALPDDPQRPEIERLIGYLTEEIKNQELEEQRLAEQKKLQEEENKRMQEELARQEAEKAQKEAEAREAEAERRRKILEDVANSLQETDSTNMTAGAEDTLEYDYESELD